VNANSHNSVECVYYNVASDLITQECARACTNVLFTCVLGNFIAFLHNFMCQVLVAGLPEGVRLTAIVDACHSGSVFDLPYSYGVSSAGKPEEQDNRMAALQQAMAAGMAVISGDVAFGVKEGMEAFKKLQGGGGDGGGGGGGGNGDNPEADVNAIKIRSTVADVIQFSG
jgi:hypothetical protein